MTTNKPVRPWDLFNSKKPKLSEEFQKERIEICLGCSELIKLTHQCKKCGCFMELKTKLADARCPIGKW
jgi:hypothetical protein